MAKKVIILGGNDTSYQLQLGMLARPGQFAISLVHDSNYVYMPSEFYPSLLAGSLHIRDAALEHEKYFSSKVNYLRFPPEDIENTCVINTVTDAHHISIVHLPKGRRRYLTLQNTDNVIMAAAELTQYQSLVVYGESHRAIAYAVAAAKAGYQSWLVADSEKLINSNFDGTTSRLVLQMLNRLGIQIIDLQAAATLTKEHPALYTPYSMQTPGLMRIKQQLNHRFDHYPKADFTLKNGGDWYHLPLQATEQLINKIYEADSDASVSHLAYLWGNQPDLPHKTKIDDFDIHYVGQLSTSDPQNHLTLTIPEHDIYRKIVLEDDRIVGFVLAGDIRGSERLTEMMLTHQNIANLRNDLLYLG